MTLVGKVVTVPDGRSPNFVPLYYQVEEAIRDKVRAGEWTAGQRVCSERELMAMFGVSRATVIRAVSSLVREGLLYRKQGKGTFVAQAKMEQTLSRFYSFTEDMKQRGLVPSTKVLQLERVRCPKHIGQILHLDEDDEVIKLVRLRLADQDPIVLETSYLPSGLFPGFLEKDHEKVALYDIMQKDYGIRVVRAREYLEATLADDRAARHLGVRIGDPLLLFERWTYAQADLPAEVCRGVIRADKYRYYVDLA